MANSELLPEGKAPAFVHEADTTPGTEAARPWAIRMEGISKRYTLGEKRSANDNFREDLMNGLKGLLKGKVQRERNSFWALRDVSLSIERGDTVGIIGRNGAGKSTLLKILSRITTPTKGTMRYRGRLASLLEVGTGFHRELTGRENIYLNGAILGMKRAEINAQFHAIVAFAGVEQFLETPVKFYSSGMYVRLAFAVAAHLRTDILVIDEVLAVGDAEFQKKCLGKMQDVAHDGRTVLFVSHNMGAVQALCKRGVYLKQGQVKAEGDIGAVIQQYTQTRPHSDFSSIDLQSKLKESGAKPQGVLLALEFRVENNPTESVLSGGELEILLKVNSQQRKNLKVGIGINDSMGQRILSLSPVYQSPEFLENLQGIVTLRCSIEKLRLMPGVYEVLVVCKDHSGPLETINSALVLEVVGTDYYKTGVMPNSGQGLYFEDATWKIIPETNEHSA
ncbi:MAG: ABC transporter ATP-binding protein [Candidatus Sumerlaeia bacterium]|nr:ABC transporter ATP-binding protein [Candidatus Sumerlaeia bacterium]